MTLPTPYYQSDRVTLYHGDCLSILPHLIGMAAIVTDQPYGINHPCNFSERGRGNLAACNDYPDVHGDDQDYDPSPILNLGLPTVLWGGNHFADKLPASGGWLVWDKERPDTLDQATCELAWTNCVKGVRRFRHLWNGMMRASERGENYHPTQKPVALWTWALSLPWLQQGLLIDPYMGAGSCGIAAIQCGRRFFGCELNEEYCAIAKRRIVEAEEVGAMFRQEPEKQAEMFPTA